jgi:hypothetical protein
LSAVAGPQCQGGGLSRIAQREGIAGGAEQGVEVNERNHRGIHDHAINGTILITYAAIVQREAEEIDGASPSWT